MSADPLERVHSLNERRERFEVNWDKRKPPKPILPDLPKADDSASQRSWLTAVLHLDERHPVTGGTHTGLAGGQGHITINRLGAPALEFKPASRIAKGETMSADLVW